MLNNTSNNDSQELEKRLDEAIEKMSANMRRGRRIVAVKRLYKDLIKADPEEIDPEKDDDDDPENA